jgi:CBS domain-containing protein
VNENILTSGRRCFPVTSGGRIEGLVTLHNIKSVPRDLWKTTSVREVMTPLQGLKAIPPDENLDSVLQMLAQNDINQLPVIRDKNIVGMISRDNIINFISVRSELDRSLKGKPS